MEGQKQYKDRLFCYLFGREDHKDWTLSLYNAVNDSHYTDPDSITIATLRQVLYLGMHNDVAFLIADEVNLYEQQSTWNPNMPLRLLQYTGNMYEKLLALEKRSKFSKSIIPLPVPKLVVFYNGRDDAPDETVLRLSDAFPEEKRMDADIQVRVRVININHGRFPSRVLACQPLREYGWLVDRIRARENKMDLGRAIDLALEEMPEDFSIKTILIANQLEVKTMLLTEYNEEREMDLLRAECRAEGLAEGRVLGRKEGHIQGRIQGRKEGEKRGADIILRLFVKLKEAGREEELVRAAADPVYLAHLCQEFGIS